MGDRFQERNDEIARLWQNGYAVPAIMRALKIETRNIIIGVIARRGLLRHGKRKATVAPVEGGGVALDRLGNNACHYPVGEPGNPSFGFCGLPVIDHRPYCAAHSKLCNVKVENAAR